jgi:hypothetical protein
LAKSVVTHASKADGVSESNNTITDERFNGLVEACATRLLELGLQKIGGRTQPFQKDIFYGLDIPTQGTEGQLLSPRQEANGVSQLLLVAGIFNKVAGRI